MKRLVTIGAVIAASLVIAVQSHAAAGGSLQSFGVTNYLVSGGAAGNVSNWPTNSINTNGSPQSTGGPLNIQMVDHVGINIQGLLVSTNTVTGADKIYLTLLTSMATGSPTVTYATNSLSGGLTIITQNDWSTTTNTSLGPIAFTIPATPGTNWINFQTNLPSTTLASDANWIGVYSISNTLATTCYITNFGVYLNTKLLPRPLSP